MGNDCDKTSKNSLEEHEFRKNYLDNTTRALDLISSRSKRGTFVSLASSSPLPHTYAGFKKKSFSKISVSLLSIIPPGIQGLPASIA